MAWSPDSRWLAACGSDESSEVCIWDTESGDLKVKVNQSPDDSLTCVAFHSCSTKFVTGGTKGQFYQCVRKHLIIQSCGCGEKNCHYFSHLSPGYWWKHPWHMGGSKSTSLVVQRRWENSVCCWHPSSHPWIHTRRSQGLSCVCICSKTSCPLSLCVAHYTLHKYFFLNQSSRGPCHHVSARELRLSPCARQCLQSRSASVGLG